MGFTITYSGVRQLEVYPSRAGKQTEILFTPVLKQTPKFMSALRTRKFARTRLTLARALAQALAAQSLSEVPVKALCQQAEVSEATFFNYFPRKQDLMTYLAHLWLLELSWHAQSAAAAASSPISARASSKASSRSISRSSGTRSRESLQSMERASSAAPMRCSSSCRRLAKNSLARLRTRLRLGP